MAQQNEQCDAIARRFRGYSDGRLTVWDGGLRKLGAVVTLYVYISWQGAEAALSPLRARLTRRAGRAASRASRGAIWRPIYRMYVHVL